MLRGEGMWNRHVATHLLTLNIVLFASACEESPTPVVDVGLFDTVLGEDALDKADTNVPGVMGTEVCAEAFELRANLLYEDQSAGGMETECLNTPDKGVFYKMAVPSQHAITVTVEASFNIFVDIIDSCDVSECQRVTAPSALRDRRAYFSNSEDIEKFVFIRVGSNASGSFSIATVLKPLRDRARCETPLKVEANEEVFAGSGALQEWCGDSTGYMFYSVDIPARSFLSIPPNAKLVSCDCGRPMDSRNISDASVTATVGLEVGTSARLAIREIPESAFCETAPIVRPGRYSSGLQFGFGGTLTTPCGEDVQLVHPHYFRRVVAPGETVEVLLTFYPDGRTGGELLMWRMSGCDAEVCAQYSSTQINAAEQSTLSESYTNETAIAQEMIWGMGVSGQRSGEQYARIRFN